MKNMPNAPHCIQIKLFAVLVISLAQTTFASKIEGFRGRYEERKAFGERVTVHFKAASNREWGGFKWGNKNVRYHYSFRNSRFEFKKDWIDGYFNFNHAGAGRTRISRTTIRFQATVYVDYNDEPYYISGLIRRTPRGFRLVERTRDPLEARSWKRVYNFIRKE